jgi:hypothetical protein
MYFGVSVVHIALECMQMQWPVVGDLIEEQAFVAGSQ